MMVKFSLRSEPGVWASMKAVLQGLSAPYRTMRSAIWVSFVILSIPVPDLIRDLLR